MSDMGFFETFVRLFPEIIKAAAASPLGVISLIVLCASLVIMAVFRRHGGPIALIAFLAFIASLTFFGWRLTEATRTLQENALVISPNSYSLSAPVTWRGPSVLVRSGTVVETNGFPFQIEATEGPVDLEGLTITSFKASDAPPPPPARPVANAGPPLPEAARCTNGGRGNKGDDGIAGQAGQRGKDATPVRIISPSTVSGTAIIRNVGMNGGNGGTGGQGGQGGQGQRGGQGRMNHIDVLGRSVPTDCACGGAWGGSPGPGGNGGPGGPPGDGGKGGDIVVRAGDASRLTIHADVQGGLQGEPGEPGQAGLPGTPGDGGRGEGPRCDDETNNRRNQEAGQPGTRPPPRSIQRERAPSGQIDAPGAKVLPL
ncbi:hypothetical protein [Craurococcus roseus]